MQSCNAQPGERTPTWTSTGPERQLCACCFSPHHCIAVGCLRHACVLIICTPLHHTVSVGTAGRQPQGGRGLPCIRRTPYCMHAMHSHHHPAHTQRHQQTDQMKRHTGLGRQALNASEHSSSLLPAGSARSSHTHTERHTVGTAVVCANSHAKQKHAKQCSLRNRYRTFMAWV